MRGKVFWMLSWLIVGCSAVETLPDDGESAAPHDDPPPRIAMDAPVEPTAEVPEARECFKQDDCPEGLTCVASSVRELRCVVHPSPPPRTGPDGRPVPPVGLLDGTALRAQMQGRP